MTPDRGRLAAAARAVLDQIDPADRDRVTARFDTLDLLVSAMCDQAEKVITKIGELKRPPVQPEQEELLLAAMLTIGRQHSGVHRNTTNALDRFERLRRHPGLVPAVAVTIRDDGRDIAALITAYHLSRELAARRPAEPPVFQAIVAAAVATLTPSADATEAGGPADAGDHGRHAEPIGPDVNELVRTACWILDRGAELADRHRATRMTGHQITTPLLGSADFLVMLAGYTHAVRVSATAVDGGGDIAGAAAADALDDIDKLLPDLEANLRRALTKPLARPPFRGPDEPDVVHFFSAAARTVGGARSREVFDQLCRGLRRIRIESDRKSQVTDFADPLSSDGSAHAGDAAVGEALERSSSSLPRPWAPTLAVIEEVDTLAARMVDILTDGATAAERAVLADWLHGRRRVDRLDDLDLLLGRLRALVGGLRRPLPAPRPPDAGEPTDSTSQPAPSDETDRQMTESAAMTAALRSRLSQAAVLDDGRHAPLALAALALPPLWTARTPIIRGLAARIKQEDGLRGSSGRVTATGVAGAATCGPGQFWYGIQAGQHDAGSDPGCATEPDANGAPRCRARANGLLPLPEKVCPARPWDEIGLVESYQTLADLAEPEMTGAAMKERLAAYRNRGSRWSVLLYPGGPSAGN